MNDIDRKIQAALQREAPDDPLSGESNLTTELLAAFRGRQRWLNALVLGVQLAALAGLIYSGYQFCHETDPVAVLRWGGLGMVLLVMVSMIKLWFWMELQSHRVLREVKRVELLLVSRPR